MSFFFCKFANQSTKLWDYAILGDDIVIADKKVAQRYQEIMTEVQGVISIEKSLISDNGSCEFAKRFFVACHKDRTDVSPVSLACMLLCRGFMSSFVFRTIGCTVKNSFRLRGGGYRVLSKVDQTNPNRTFGRLELRWKRHWLTLLGEGGLMPLPLDMWLAFPEQGYLTPYQVGVARSFLLESLRPKDFMVESFELYRHFWQDDVEWMGERLLVSLIHAHCRYLKWYWTLFSDPSRPLSDFLKPPVSPRKLTREAEVRYNLRYGVIFRTWDRLRNAPIPLALGLSSHFKKEAVETRIFLNRWSTVWTKETIETILSFG